MLPNLSPFIRNSVHHHNLNRQHYKRGVEKIRPFCNQEKNTRKGEFHYSIVLFRLAQTSPALQLEKKKLTRKTHWRVGGAGNTEKAFKTRYLRKLSWSVRERRAVQL